MAAIFPQQVSTGPAFAPSTTHARRNSTAAHLHIFIAGRGLITHTAAFLPVGVSFEGCLCRPVEASAEELTPGWSGTASGATIDSPQQVL